MSATNRGATRRKSDFYGTPPEAVEALIEHGLKPMLGGDFGVFYDLGIGTGFIANVFKKHGWITGGIELDEDRAHAAQEQGHKVIQGDFLEADVVPAIQDIVDTLKSPFAGIPLVTGGNTPYSLAKEFILRGIEATDTFVTEESQDRRLHVQLLRINILGSISKRRELVLPGEEPNGWHLRRVVPLGKRPPFVAHAKCALCSGEWWLEPWTKPYLHPVEDAIELYPGEPPRQCPNTGLKPNSKVSKSSRYTVTTTDATEYAWLIWSPEEGPCELRVAEIEGYWIEETRAYKEWLETLADAVVAHEGETLAIAKLAERAPELRPEIHETSVLPPPPAPEEAFNVDWGNL